MAQHLYRIKLSRSYDFRYRSTTSPQRRRAHRVVMGIMRNSSGATAVVPYAVRALPGAPVATPLGWNELRPSIHSSQAYTLRTIGEPLQTVGDVWKGTR